MGHGIKIDGSLTDLDELTDPLEEDRFLRQVHTLTGYSDEDWQDHKKAEAAFQKYKNIDPFPEIDPALLNSSDIIKYVWKTGMLCPFYPKKLQGASYEVAIRGKVIFWDDAGRKIEQYVDRDTDSFELKPNSIAFVTLEPTFQIPDYIALRFNLKISHVYKGLLLGTGPLVDPGFQGKLSIPLHNLTSNTYRFYGGDGIIKMEFTKLSMHPEWKETTDEDISLIYRRNFIKPNRVVDDYLKKAIQSSNSVIRSSIPDEIAKVSKKSDEIQDHFDDFKNDVQNTDTIFRDDIDKRLNHLQIVNVATILAIAAMVVSILTFTWNVISRQAEASSESTNASFQELEEKYSDLNQKYEDLRNKYDEIITENRTSEIQNDANTQADQ